MTPAPGDFADQRPDAYRAFEQSAVKPNAAGIHVGLPDRMCLDKHIPDLLACLPCWLCRNMSQKPWRLQCLDLSNNALGDESIVQLIHCLRASTVGVQRLLLAGNRIQAAATHAITEYAWDSQDAMRELDLSGNEITVTTLTGDDPVSALLRCFYNHSAYPRRIARQGWVAGRREAFDLEPLMLRIGGNFLKDPVRLLGLVCEKGGLERVRLRPSPEVYQPCCEEFLSLCLPDFSKQRCKAAADGEKEKPVTADAFSWGGKPRPVSVAVAEGEEWSAPDLDELEEKVVQQALAEKLGAPDCNPSLAGDKSEAARWTIAGMAIALLGSGRSPGTIVSELEALIGSPHAQPLLEWLVDHLRTLRGPVLEELD